MEQVLLFANPISGRGRGRTIACRLHEHLSRLGYTVRSLLHRADLQDPAVFEPPGSIRAVIVIGGDGTLLTVARRVMAHALRKNAECGSASPCGGTGRAELGVQHSAVKSSEQPVIPPLLVVPMGNANLMGQYLEIRWNDADLEQRVAEALRRRKIIWLDAARANGELFLLVAGVGIDAQIVHELDRIRRGPVGYHSYLLPAALSLGQYRYPPLRVTVDGRVIFRMAPAMAFVGNIREYGTGFPLLPYARPDDGLLDICVLPCRARGQVLSLFLHAAAGEHLQGEGVIYTKGRHVLIESPEPVPLQVDGDPAGHTPVEIDLLPVRMPFIVP